MTDIARTSEEQAEHDRRNAAAVVAYQKMIEELMYEFIVNVSATFAPEQVLALVEHLEKMAPKIDQEKVAQFAADVRAKLGNPDECGE